MTTNPTGGDPTDALKRIARGKYDGREVTHYSARECREIARAALRNNTHLKGTLP